MSYWNWEFLAEIAGELEYAQKLINA